MLFFLFNELMQLKICRNSQKNLSNETRIAIYEMLLQKSVDEKLRTVALHFLTSIQTVQHIWRLSNYAECAPSGVYGRREKSCGRKKIEMDHNHFHAITL